MKAVDRGLVVKVERYIIHDGPGIRSTVYMKGCPLRCLWCSSPETWRAAPELLLERRCCTLCGKCLDVCPQGALSIAGDNGEQPRLVVNRSRCDLCLECVRVCSKRALALVGTSWLVSDLVALLKADELLYRNSRGGVTISGGEPLAQAEFVLDLLRACKAERLHTALDTSGSGHWETMAGLLEFVDLLLFDVKQVDADRHRALTGLGNEDILQNLRKAAAVKRTWLRVPLVPGCNDSDEDLRRLGQLASAIRPERVCLLPYHEWGRPMYQKLGLDYPLVGMTLHSRARLEAIAEQLRSPGLDVRIGG